MTFEKELNSTEQTIYEELRVYVDEKLSVLPPDSASNLVLNIAAHLVIAKGFHALEEVNPNGASMHYVTVKMAELHAMCHNAFSDIMSQMIVRTITGVLNEKKGRG